MEAKNNREAGILKQGRPTLTVLVEEEILVRRLWEDHYRKNGWALEVFENPLDFLSQLNRFTGRDEKICFFLDQDFGSIRGVGLQVARAVKGLNVDQTISLVTNYEPRDFDSAIISGQIQQVFGKYPEVIFGTDFFNRQFRANIGLFADAYPSGRCALEKALNYDGWSLEFTLEEHFPSLAPNPVVEPRVEITQAVHKQDAAPSLKTSSWARIYKFLIKPFAFLDVSFGRTI